MFKLIIILIIGGVGFIGLYFVCLMVSKYFDYYIVNFDVLIYVGNLENFKDIENVVNYIFVKVDIMDVVAMQEFFVVYDFDGVIYLVVEFYVDCLIVNLMSFIEINIVGMVVLFNVVKQYWGDFFGKCFYYVFIDEVYGILGEIGFFIEEMAYDLCLFYLVFKVSLDYFVWVYYYIYGLFIVIFNCLNNYGFYQFLEKLLLLMINNICYNKLLLVYGDGKYICDWFWVEDYVVVIDFIYYEGKNGEMYNIGGNNEWKNIDLVYQFCDVMDDLLGCDQGIFWVLIIFVKDWLGYDCCYVIDVIKLMNEFNWALSIQVEEGLCKIVEWYFVNIEWLEWVIIGAYQVYYE